MSQRSRMTAAASASMWLASRRRLVPAARACAKRCAASREMFAANAWSTSRIENMQSVDITEKRHRRGAFVKRIVWLCRNGCCVALCKLGIRYTSDGLRRFIHVCHALASVSKGNLAIVNVLDAGVDRPVVADQCLMRLKCRAADRQFSRPAERASGDKFVARACRANDVKPQNG